MESYDFLIFVAIILLSTKIFGILSEKVHMPQVVGALLVGIILGPSCFNILHETDFIVKSAEIGVIFLMFLAGLDTEMDELKSTGKASLIIAVIGVVIPLLGGLGVYLFFFKDVVSGDLLVLEGVFIGVVLTATSVSITVETLKEMGKLKGKVGTAILGAAIIDDILGIITLTVITSFADPNVNIFLMIIKIVLFFIFVLICGIIMSKLFKLLEEKYGSRRRVAIYAVSFCLFMSFCAEEFFGVADITGAYFAGLILCNTTEIKSYIASKITIVSYMFFTPIFFASIGIKTVISGLTPTLITFSIVLLIIAILTKIIGCGFAALVCGFSKSDALSIGIGMVSRGEVALIVAQKGAQVGLISEAMFPPIVVVVIVTTLLTPIMLKITMKDTKKI